MQPAPRHSSPCGTARACWPSSAPCRRTARNLASIGCPTARHEAHAVASGRALLCDLSDAQLDELYQDFVFTAYAPPAAQSLAELRDMLQRRLSHAGYVISRAVLTKGVISVAAPVRNSDGLPVAAVTLSGRTLAGAEREGLARDKVIEAASLISVGLGFRSHLDRLGA